MVDPPSVIDLNILAGLALPIIIGLYGKCDQLPHAGIVCLIGESTASIKMQAVCIPIPEDVCAAVKPFFQL